MRSPSWGCGMSIFKILAIVLLTLGIIAITIALVVVGAVLVAIDAIARFMRDNER